MPYQSVFKSGLFTGQTIIVTGGGSGIGRCTAHELAALGATVVLMGRNAEKLAQVEAEIREDGGVALSQVCGKGRYPSCSKARASLLIAK